MEKTGTPWKTTSKTCASSAKMDYSVLSKCYSGSEGDDLQKKFAALTPSDHKYTPWVVINGKVMSQSATFLSAVCKAYKGTKPAGCSSSLIDSLANASYAVDMA